MAHPTIPCLLIIVIIIITNLAKRTRSYHVSNIFNELRETFSEIFSRKNVKKALVELRMSSLNFGVSKCSAL